MNFIEKTTNREAMLKYLTESATADCEADVERFLDVFNPTADRAEMGHIFYEHLGYNPITYYDFQDVLKVLDGLLEKVGKKKASVIQENKDAIVVRAQAIYEENRDENIRVALDMAIQEFIPDWNVRPPKYNHDTRPVVSDEEEDSDADDLAADLPDDDEGEDDGDDDDSLSLSDEDEDFNDLESPKIPGLDELGADDEDEGLKFDDDEDDGGMDDEEE